MRTQTATLGSKRALPGAYATTRKSNASPLQRARLLPTARAAVKTVKEGAKTVKGTTPTNGTSSGKGNLGTKGTFSGIGTSSSKTGTSRSTTSSRSPGYVPTSPGSQSYFNFVGFPFPLGPIFSRKTIRKEVVKGTIWTFEQTQALEVFNVYTPVRMTVIKLKSGGLWVHAPVAPTDECRRLIRELDAPVEYIVLPTFAYEHKVFVGPFSRAFPKAKVYITPYQWSFPLNLPPQLLGIFPAGELTTEGSATTPWADEISQKLLLPPSIGVGDYVRFSEVAFFHTASKTLLVTDAVVFIDETPPEVVPTRALLECARDNLLARSIAGGLSKEEVERIAEPGPVEDTLENRIKGWKRMTLLVLYFSPGNLLQPNDSFAAVSDKLIVGPVVETLVYNKVPQAVREWVDSICSDWAFRQIIPCHFSAPIKAGPAEFKRAFSFAYPPPAEGATPAEPEKPKGWAGLLPFPLPFFGQQAAAAQLLPSGRVVDFPEGDMKILNGLNNKLLQLGVVFESKEEV